MHLVARAMVLCALLMGVPTAFAQTFPTPTFGSVIFNPGATPSPLSNGQCWVANSGSQGLYCRINGFTVGPFSTSSGTVTTTGSPANGNLTKFSGSASITNGDLSGDVTTSGTTATTVGKVDGVAYPAGPSTNTVPVVTGTNAVTYEAVPNAALANTTITINTVVCTLGGSCTITASAGTITIGGTAIASGTTGDLLYDNAGSLGNETLSAAIDAGPGSTQGDILYRNASQWVVLAPGTNGNCLQTGGAAANPSWGSCGGGIPWTTPSVSGTASSSYIIGGTSNTINTANSGATNNVIAGGSSNSTGNATGQFIGGGSGNSTSANNASVIGGASNASNGINAISGGTGNTAGNQNSIALGTGNTVSANQGVALGDGNQVSGVSASALGRDVTLSGQYSFGTGQLTGDRGTSGAFVEGGLGGPSANSSHPGRGQSVVYTLWSDVSNATASRLTTTGGGASSTNIGVLPGGPASATWNCRILISDKTTAGKIWVYTIADSLVYTTSSSSATTALGTSNPSPVAGPTAGSPSALQAAPTLTADTSLGGFNLSYTPPSGNTDELYAIAICRAVETQTN